MQGSILKEAVRALSNQQAEEVRNLFANISTTHKNLYLYPEDHSICQESIRQLHGKLEAYIRQNGDVTCQRSFKTEPISVVKSEPPAFSDRPVSGAAFPILSRSL